MDGELQGPAIALVAFIVLASGWLAVTIAWWRRQNARGRGGALARSALLEFAERSLDLETGRDVLALAGEAASAIFGSQRAVALEPDGDSGAWSAAVAAGEPLPAVPGALRGAFAWFRHNPVVAVRDQLDHARFGAMREPLRQLCQRYDVDVLIPLVKGEDVLAALALKLDRRPSSLERELLRVLKLQATAAYANIDLHRAAAHRVSLAEEVDLANSVQLALTPQAAEGKSGEVEWAGHFEPAGEAASDFWSVYELPDGRAAFVMGDTVAEGLGGSMISAVVKSCNDAIMEDPPEDLDPGQLLAMLGRSLARRSGEAGQTTCFAAFIDAGRGEIAYASAGHPPPYVAEDRDGQRRLGALTRPGPLLGDSEGATNGYRVSRRTLAAGGTVVMYTDGLVHVSGDARADDRRLRRLLAVRPDSDGAAALRDAILAELRAYRTRAAVRDDAALVVAKV